MNLFANIGNYNNAAELLADENQFAGVDIARFGKDSDIILERENLSGRSILSKFADALKIFSGVIILTIIKYIHVCQKVLKANLYTWG